MSQIRHNNGLSEQVSEIGFDTVKYFEGDITSTATCITVEPPARRLRIRNANSTDSVFVRINECPADTIVSLTPGDDIRIGPLCEFNMDFDTINKFSMVASGTTPVTVEGLLGFKGIASC